MERLTLVNVLLLIAGIAFVVFNKHVAELSRGWQRQLSAQDPGTARFRMPTIVFGLFLILVSVARIIG